MKRARTLSRLAVLCAAFAIPAFPQSTAVGLSGIATGTIQPPASPALTSVGCGSSGTTWTYSIVVNDAAGNSGKGGSAAIGTCTSLSPTVYIKVATVAAVGSTGCMVYRTTAGTSPSSTGAIATVACGSTLADTGLPASGTEPTPNTTGGVNTQFVSAANGVTAASFTATNGLTAGGDTFVQGAAITAAPQPTSVTLEAPVSVATYAIALPQTYPTQTQVMLFGTSSVGSGSLETTQASFGTLTDGSISSPVVATATLPLANGDLVSVSNPSGSAADLVDSGIPAGTVPTVYSTASSTTGGSLSAATMVTAPSIDAQNCGGSTNATCYRLSAYAFQVGAGTTCTANTNIAVQAIFTDPLSSAASTVTFAAFLITTNGSNDTPIPPSTAGSGATLAVGSGGGYVFRAKPSSTVQYKTTVTIGGCTSVPTYFVIPFLEQL